MIARASFLCAQMGKIELVKLLSLIMDNLVKGEIIAFHSDMAEDADIE